MNCKKITHIKYSYDSDLSGNNLTVTRHALVLLSVGCVFAEYASGAILKIITGILFWGAFVILFRYRGSKIKSFLFADQRTFWLRIYFFYGLFLIIRCLIYDSNLHFEGNKYLTLFGSNKFGCFIYIFPLLTILSTGYSIFLIKKTLIIVGYIILGYTIYVVIFRPPTETLPSFYVICMTFAYIIPFVPYLRRKIWVVLPYFCLALLCLYFEERASFVFLLMGLGAFFVVEYLKIIKLQNVYIYVGVLVSVVVLVFSLSYGVSIFSILEELYGGDGVTQDTRSFIFYELSEDLSDGSQWLFGKGVLGTCYSPYFDRSVTDGDSAYRVGLEVGFLQYILKGGLFFLCIYMMLLISAAYYGINKSSNSFSKLIGLISINNFIVSCISQGPALIMPFLVLWILLGCSFSKSILNMTDIQIKKIISYDPTI